MQTRRSFLHATAVGSAGLIAASRASVGLEAKSPDILPSNQADSARFRPSGRFGLGGVAMGNGFSPARTDELMGAVDAAWREGVRYFDTSPWYGLGLSERRFGVFLQNAPREEMVISTKIGRILKPDAAKAGKDVAIWKDIPPFAYTYDYTAEGTRRSIEDSLQRMGLARLDLVFVHDLSPDNEDFGEKWTEQFEIASKGAFPELSRMRDEGLIKGWGMGVNRIEPAMRCFEEADPDIMLLATQYSLIDHENPLKEFFPRAEKAGASVVLGAPLMAGFLAGRQRYLYGPGIPEGALEKRARLSRIAHDHDTDLVAASLQFCIAPEVVSAVIPGARNARQVEQNADAIRAKIPAEFWETLKSEGLISEDCPLPKA